VVNAELVDRTSESRISAVLGASQPVIQTWSNILRRDEDIVVHGHQRAIDVEPTRPMRNVGGPNNLGFGSNGRPPRIAPPDSVMAAAVIDPDIPHQVPVPRRKSQESITAAGVTDVLTASTVAQIPDPSPVGAAFVSHPSLDGNRGQVGQKVVGQIDVGSARV